MFDNDISQDINMESILDSVCEGRDRGYSFQLLLGAESEAELPDFSSAIPFDEMCSYVQNGAYAYNSDPSTAASIEDMMDEAICLPSLSSKLKRIEARPTTQYSYVALTYPAKRIGNLTPEERYRKIQRYKEKRERRVWSKKINYGCRKRVADNRLRIKGRFVTKEQAKAISVVEAPRSAS